MTENSALNARFGIPGQVFFKEGPGGLDVVEVVNALGSATVALQGAQVMTWAPRGQPPVIWLSRAARFAPGKSIRGGVPVCWPWFGPHPTETTFPAHGFARTVPWEATGAQTLADGATRIDFRLTPNAITCALWPPAASLECRIIIGAALEIDLVTRNTGGAVITIGDALHTYFEVGDVREIAIQGLDGCPYIDMMDGAARKRQSGPVTIAAETDRIYLDSTADCLIDDPGLRRRIRVSKRGSRSTVVWNPWIEKSARMGDFVENGYMSMVCVESANAADDVVTIAPGGEHHLWVRYRVEPLS